MHSERADQNASLRPLICWLRGDGSAAAGRDGGRESLQAVAATGPAVETGVAKISPAGSGAV